MYVCVHLCVCLCVCVCECMYSLYYTAYANCRQFVNLSTIDSSEREFPQGCYKLDTESDGEKLLVYTDFER